MNEQRFNEAWEKLMRFIFLTLYFALRHIKRRWRLVLPTMAVFAACYVVLRYLPTVPWHIPTAIALAALLANVVIGLRDEHGQVHIHAYAVEDALKACNLWDSTHYRRPRLLTHKMLPGGDIQLTFDSSVTEDVWPSIESRFCGAFGVVSFAEFSATQKIRFTLCLPRDNSNALSPMLQKSLTMLNEIVLCLWAKGSTALKLGTLSHSLTCC